MAASAWTCYDVFVLKLGQKAINLGSDTIKCALYTSASNVNNSSLATPTYAAATNELPTANGYTAGGVTVTPTWSQSAGTGTFTVTNPTWTPTGPGIVCRFAVLYDSTTGDLICWSLLDTTPADVNVVSITINASGVFTTSHTP